MHLDDSPEFVDLTQQLAPTVDDTDRYAAEDSEPGADDGETDRQVQELDLHTRLLVKMVRAAVTGWRLSPPTAVSIRTPARRGPLPLSDLPFGKLQIPTLDEDWPSQGLVRAATLRFLRSIAFPVRDEDAQWASREEARDAFAQLFPACAVLDDPVRRHEEMQSDAAQSRLAFAGLAALRLLPVSGGDPDGAVWVSDLAYMSAFEVREGFERYGAVAYFNVQQRIVRIHWSAKNRDVRPGDADWEHAKWVWRSTLLVGTTVSDHLVAVHWLIGNYVTHAERSCFDVDHPLRRLLQPFTWRTITINYNATFSLCPKRGFVHRTSALTYESLISAFEASVSFLQFSTVPELIARKGALDMGDDFPWATDALALWNVIHAFVDEYVSLYFAGDAVTRDPSVQAFWKILESATAFIGIPTLSRENLVGLLSQFIWCVTGLHEAVGAVLEYVCDPSFVGTKLRAGHEMADKQASIQQMAIATLTGLEMPKLLNDFGHVCLDRNGSDCFDRFQGALRDLAARIDAANETRRWPCNTFNPRFLGCGVNI